MGFETDIRYELQGFTITSLKRVLAISILENETLEKSAETP